MHYSNFSENTCWKIAFIRFSKQKILYAKICSADWVSAPHKYLSVCSNNLHIHSIPRTQLYTSCMDHDPHLANMLFTISTHTSFSLFIETNICNLSLQNICFTPQIKVIMCKVMIVNDPIVACLHRCHIWYVMSLSCRSRMGCLIYSEKKPWPA